MDSKTAADLLNVQRKGTRKRINITLYPETLEMVDRMAEMTGAAKARIIEQAIVEMFRKAQRIARQDDNSVEA